MYTPPSAAGSLCWTITTTRTNGSQIRRVKCWIPHRPLRNTTRFMWRQSRVPGHPILGNTTYLPISFLIFVHSDSRNLDHCFKHERPLLIMFYVPCVTTAAFHKGDERHDEFSINVWTEGGLVVSDACFAKTRVCCTLEKNRLEPLILHAR